MLTATFQRSSSDELGMKAPQVGQLQMRTDWRFCLTRTTGRHAHGACCSDKIQSVTCVHTMPKSYASEAVHLVKSPLLDQFPLNGSPIKLIRSIFRVSCNSCNVSETGQTKQTENTLPRNLQARCARHILQLR